MSLGILIMIPWKFCMFVFDLAAIAVPLVVPWSEPLSLILDLFVIQGHDHVGVSY